MLLISGRLPNHFALVRSVIQLKAEQNSDELPLTQLKISRGRIFRLPINTSTDQQTVLTKPQQTKQQNKSNYIQQ